MKEKEYSVIKKFSHPNDYFHLDYSSSRSPFLDMIKPISDKRAVLHPKIIQLCDETIPFIEKTVVFQLNDYVKWNEETTHPIYTPHIIFNKQNTVIVLPTRFNEYIQNDDPVQLTDSIIFVLSVIECEKIRNVISDTSNRAESYASQVLIDHGLENIKKNEWRQRILAHYPHGLETDKKA